MAKKPKVPLNVLVVESTRQAIKDLAESLECSQGEVIDRALLAFDTGAINAGRVPESIEFSRSQIEPATGLRHDNILPPDNRPKNCFCKHCGSRFAGPKFSTICSECKGSGHTLTPAECPRCTEASAI